MHYTFVGGASVTNLVATQTNLSSVQVSWTAPSPAPTRGYQITTANTEDTTTQTTHVLTLSQPGNHNVTVQPLSQHLPHQLESVLVTVRGDHTQCVAYGCLMHNFCAGVLAPSISLSAPATATSASLSWSQPQFSLTVLQYTVSLTRVTGSGQTLCPSLQDNRPAVTTTGNSMAFTELEEFSSYRVTVTAVYDAFGETRMASSTEGFTTLSAGRST